MAVCRSQLNIIASKIPEDLSLNNFVYSIDYKKSGKVHVLGIDKLGNYWSDIEVMVDFGRFFGNSFYGNDKPIIDLLIAATAKLNNLTLVTLDRDFKIISEIGEFDLILVEEDN